MGSVTFIQQDGERISTSIRPGNTVMEAAVASEVPGIEAQCYGAGICGTCHVYVQGEASSVLPEPSQWEQDMLANLELSHAASRLSCQIKFNDSLEGAEFLVPERQDAMA